MLDLKSAYHVARRAMTRITVYGKERYVYRDNQLGVSDSVSAIRAAVAESIGRKTLPRGSADIPRRLYDAVKSARTVVVSPDFATRITLRRRASYLAESARRGLPTELNTAKNGSEPLQLIDQATTPDGYRVGLLRAEGYAKYSNRVGSWPCSLAILAGRDDAGLWAVRIPGTLHSAKVALDWLMPAVVRNARAAGMRVLRQGDVWVVERKRDGMARADLPSGHVWDAARRELIHDNHVRLAVPWPAMAVRQATLAARGVGRRRGD